MDNDVHRVRDPTTLTPVPWETTTTTTTPTIGGDEPHGDGGGGGGDPHMLVEEGDPLASMFAALIAPGRHGGGGGIDDDGEGAMTRNHRTAADAGSDTDESADVLLPVTTQQDERLRRRQTEQMVAARRERERLEAHIKAETDRMAAVQYRELRSRQSAASWHDRRHRFLGWLETNLLPASFTTIRVEEGQTQWRGLVRMQEFWTEHRRPLLATLTALALLACLWLAGPPAWRAAFGGPRPDLGFDPWSASPLAGGDGSGDGHEAGRDRRLDAGGRWVVRPMPMHDLLYDRDEWARRRDAAAVGLAEQAARAIDRLWQHGDPPPAGGRAAPLRTDMHVVPPTAFATYAATDKYASGPVWDQLIDVGALIDRRRRSDSGGGSGGGGGATAMDNAADRLRIRWVRAVCAGQQPGVAESDFVASVAAHGTFEFDVSEYAPDYKPPPSASPSTHLPASVSPSTVKAKSKAAHEPVPGPTPLEELLQAAQGRAKTPVHELDADTAATSEAADRPLELPAPQPPLVPVVRRNASAYELAALMTYLSVRAHEHMRTYEQSPPSMQGTLGVAVARAAARFERALLTAAEARDPWQIMVAVQLTTLEQAGNADLLALRGAALWTDTTAACICAHHVGAPIPGAAWHDPLTRQTHVLFYPRRDLPSRWGVGNLVGGLRGWLGGVDSVTSEENPALPDGESDVVQWYLTDPVIPTQVAQVGDPRPRRLTIAARTAFDGSPEWIEGVDASGARRRHAASGPGLACVLSCAAACPAKGSAATVY